MILDSAFDHDVIREVNTEVIGLAELAEADTRVALSVFTVFEVGVGLRGEAEQ